MSGLDKLHWFVAFNGIADSCLWGFDADDWELVYHDPAGGCLAILPRVDGPAATIEDARWLADALAFDHDAPVGIRPAWDGEAFPAPAAHPTLDSVWPLPRTMTEWYWNALNMGYGAAAELRFNGSYVIRYDDAPGAPKADFASRFRGREDRVVLYAMAARQPDLLSEYLCLYRLLEAADKGNGKKFIAANLRHIGSYQFGELLVVDDSSVDGTTTNAFEVYRDRAQRELERLRDDECPDIAAYLYAIRNSLAHGKHDVLTDRHSDRFIAAGHALPIVKLLARIAVED